MSYCSSFRDRSIDYACASAPAPPSARPPPGHRAALLAARQMALRWPRAPRNQPGSGAPIRRNITHFGAFAGYGAASPPRAAGCGRGRGAPLGKKCVFQRQNWHFLQNLLCPNCPTWMRSINSTTIQTKKLRVIPDFDAALYTRKIDRAPTSCFHGKCPWSSCRFACV